MGHDDLILTYLEIGQSSAEVTGKINAQKVSYRSSNSLALLGCERAGLLLFAGGSSLRL